MNEVFKSSSDFIANYIDDFLVYSDSMQKHLEHLKLFHHLVTTHAIGLSASKDKFQIAQTDIEFLGVHLKNGKIHMHPHVLKKIDRFPDQLYDKEQCKKFLGCLNYVREYIPKLSQKIKETRRAMVSQPFS